MSNIITDSEACPKDRLNILLSGITKDNRLVKNLFELVPLPYSSVRRKMEIKRRQDVYKKQAQRKKQSARLQSKFRTRKLKKLRVQKCRKGEYGFRERYKYYDSLEKSYWYYLRRKYGKYRILTIEEFEEHIAPNYYPGRTILARKDPGRLDWFLDNIIILEDKEALREYTKQFSGRSPHRTSKEKQAIIRRLRDVDNSKERNTLSSG